MQNTKRLYWIAQFLGWGIYAGLAFFANYVNNPQNVNSYLVTSILILVFCGILVTHGMRWFLVGKNWISLPVIKLIPRLFVISVIAAILLSLISSICIDFITRNIEHSGEEKLTYLKIILEAVGASMLIILWNAIYFTYHYFRKSISQEIYNLQLLQSQTEIELKNLRSQLNPHFLFNSLNSIRALIDIEPSNAKRSITTLSNLLRNSLILGKSEFITLKEELEVVQGYLAIEKIRFEERLTIIYEIDENLLTSLIPPFIIQSMVENSIKHGISKLVKGGTIFIKISKSESYSMMIEVINTGRLLNNSSEGIGIENTKRRLYLLYQNNASFHLFQEGENVVSSIHII